MKLQQTLSILSLVGLICSLGFPIGYSNETSAVSSSYENVFDSKKEADPSGLVIHNRVLFKVNEDLVVTTLDVIQKLNLLFYTSYPHLIDSFPARSQYYTTMWPVVVESVIDEFLMVADAKVKKIGIDPTIVNQEIEEIFGRDLSSFYVHFDMTPEDIFKVMERTLTAQRVVGMMVRSKAMLKITPGKIREHYNQLSEEAAQTPVWKYRVVTLKANTESLASQIADKVFTRLNETKTWDKERLSALVLSQGGQMVCSEEFCRKEQELSKSHRIALEEISYPDKLCSLPRAHKSGFKIYVLLDKSIASIESLDVMEPRIKQHLFVMEAEGLEKRYKEKLRNRYGYDASMIAKLLSEEAPPLLSLL
ncbi:hypothetical protein [Candidatus Chlamydia sanziniae]|uniref:PpiC domain-containing protein n=1 Tax=Candidatus Chlamydia sanziniae TaxID=1806891 RepID=A0A1A9HUZ0_9CHLA|nr:hypothetical protein [Candidatus Chlamydia sanziniae]ANH78221.1 hypothetical protein Cs308_0045 [Candidatus Chlamydia sanziniae]